VLGDHTNIVTVTAADDEDTGATGTDDATVTILPPSAIAESNLCHFDRMPDLDGQQFRLPFTPDMQLWPAYKLSTSNPGQFFYNVFYTGQGSANFEIVIPEQFVTSGAVPVRVYTEVSVVSVGGFDCFVPDPASEIYAGDTLNLVGIDDPDDSLIYVTVFLDYGFKGTTGYAQNLHDDALDAETGEVLIPNLNDYTFAVSGSQNDSQTLQNVNAFKRIPGIGGLVIDGQGDPLVGVQVDLYDPDGQLMITNTTDEDGWYLFEYKHKGKQAEYTIELPDYSASQTVLLKANKFAEVNFTIQ
jgi:hypothetical protein